MKARKENTVEIIRALYPKPKALPSNGRADGGYCVGGAAVRYIYDGEGPAFPGVGELRNALQKLNPTLSEYQAQDHAYSIVGQNDSYHYDRAWYALERALNRKGEHQR